VLETLNIEATTVWEQVIRVVSSCETGMGDRRSLTPRACRALELSPRKKRCVEATSAPNPGILCLG
jgi:hypothetical protein